MKKVGSGEASRDPLAWKHLQDALSLLQLGSRRRELHERGASPLVTRIKKFLLLNHLRVEVLLRGRISFSLKSWKTSRRRFLLWLCSRLDDKWLHIFLPSAVFVCLITELLWNFDLRAKCICSFIRKLRSFQWFFVRGNSSRSSRVFLWFFTQLNFIKIQRKFERNLNLNSKENFFSSTSKFARNYRLHPSHCQTHLFAGSWAKHFNKFNC